MCTCLLCCVYTVLCVAVSMCAMSVAHACICCVHMRAVCPHACMYCVHVCGECAHMPVRAVGGLCPHCVGPGGTLAMAPAAAGPGGLGDAEQPPTGDGAQAGLGRDAWQRARGVLGTGPRRKSEQQRRRRHGNAAQRWPTYTRPRPSSMLQGGVRGSCGLRPSLRGSVPWESRASSWSPPRRGAGTGPCGPSFLIQKRQK